MRDGFLLLFFHHYNEKTKKKIIFVINQKIREGKSEEKSINEGKMIYSAYQHK